MTATQQTTCPDLLQSIHQHTADKRRLRRNSSITSLPRPHPKRSNSRTSLPSQNRTPHSVLEALCPNNWSKATKDSAINMSTYCALEKGKGKLTVGLTSHVILRRNRIIIPAKLRQLVVDLAHEGHQGIMKTKALLREKVWFAGINKMTEERVKSCLACQAATPERRQGTLSSPLPQSAGQRRSRAFYKDHQERDKHGKN